MKIFRIIPFSWLPSSWGLSGRVRQEQEARYYNDGLDLDLELAEIYYTGEEYAHARLEALRKHDCISQEDYEVEKAGLIADPIEKEIALVMVELEAGRITEMECEKKIATIRGEPWVKVVRDGFLDEEMGPDSYYFEFDWNEIWIAKLKESGYRGDSDDAIVQEWFQDVCRTEARESIGDMPDGLIVS